jgi:hypothetical protein
MRFVKKLNTIKSALFTFSLIITSLPILAHSGHTHKAPWEACFDAKKDQACEYRNANKDIFKGTCQVFSERLMCVRNQPIIKAESSQKKSDILDKALIVAPAVVGVKLN